MPLIREPFDAPDTDAVLAIDVGAHAVKVGIVGPTVCDVGMIPTSTPAEDWSVERLCQLATDLYERAVAAGVTPVSLTVNANGQVDEYHGAVQYSPGLAWHDVGVKARVAEAVACEVIVRQSVRAAVLAESNIGVARGQDGVLFVSLGEGIIAAGASSGVVVADHVGAGDIGQMRIRSGPGEGRTLEDFASARAIVRRYTEAGGADASATTAADVHARLGWDAVARRVWDEAMSALVDGLEWSSIVFAPMTLVLGGGMANAGADLLEPISSGITRRMGAERSPAVRLATYGQYAGLVGGVLVGWKKAGWSPDQLEGILTALRTVRVSDENVTPPVVR